MRLKFDSAGYVCCVLYGCTTDGCSEYEGTVPTEPEEYSDIDDWADRAQTQAYYLNDQGNLAYDVDRAAQIPDEDYVEPEEPQKYTAEQLRALGILDIIYPIGSIYMSVNNVSPEVLFGGTWEQIEDRFILAAGSSYSAGSEGGTATHKHVAPIGYESSSEYIGTVNVNGATKSFSTAGGYNSVQKTAGGSSVPSSVSAYYTETVSNIPPYLAVYVWRRVEAPISETSESFLDKAGNTFLDANSSDFLVEVV